MFAKTIVLSDAFLDMPMSARCLYFTLGMVADDDGFVNSPRSIMRQIGASDDDIKLLIAKRFVLIFDSGVIVIKHWRLNNYLQKDRVKPTVYQDEMSTLKLEENGAYTEDEKPCIQIPDRQISTTAKETKELRLQAKKESSLPYTFDQQIRNAFVGEKCPICGKTMSYEFNTTKPTIQHNTPISMGGKHELDNISVICQSCNCSIQNKQITPPYNTEKVKEVWAKLSDVYTVDVYTEENSIDKYSIDKSSIEEVRKGESERETADLPAEKKKFGKYCFLTEEEFASLLSEFGSAEFIRRKFIVDKQENEGKDFVELIRGVE